jgi:membrane associated rhomboid family serine protease
VNSFKLWYRRQPVALRTLIAINVVFYLAWLLLLGRIPTTSFFIRNHLALNTALPGVVLEAWQLVTYNFLHFGFLHILFNMLWLWWIGREFEDLHGPHQVLALYLIGGIGGGLLSVLGYALMGRVAVVHGASASVLAVMAAVVTLYPQKRIRLLFFGTVRLLWVVAVFLALDVLLGAAGGNSNTAILAHLGGAGTGYLFVRAGERGMDLTSWAKVFFSGDGRSRGRYAPGRSSGGSSSSGGGGLFGGLFGRSGSRGGRSSSHRRETLRQERDRKKAERSRRRQEVDRILDKISEEGYDALSDDEKRTLEDASRQ